MQLKDASWWCSNKTNDLPRYGVLFSINKATEDDVTTPINDAQLWPTMQQTTIMLWFWSTMSRMTMMFQYYSMTLQTTKMFRLLNLAKRIQTRFKDINIWLKMKERKNKCKEKEMSLTSTIQNYRKRYHHKTLLSNKGLNTCNTLMV